MSPPIGPGHFYDDWMHPGAVVGHGQNEFPWEEVFQRLDGSPARVAADQRVALLRLLQWVLSEQPRVGSSAKAVGTRFVGLAWCVDPSLLGGSSISEIARRFGVSKRTLTVITGSFSREFGYRNPGQRHAWNFNPKAAQPPGKTNDTKNPRPKHR